jgi:hypothetical protein
VGLMLAGCGGANGSGGTPVQPKQSEQGQQAAVEQTQTPAPDPESVLGDATNAGDYTIRVLDLWESDSYFYEQLYMHPRVDTFAMNGKFLVVPYSIRNTSGSKVDADLTAVLHAGDETYEQATDVVHPRHDMGVELQTRQVEVSEFIFDVPPDVKAESIEIQSVGRVDLTHGNPFLLRSLF